MSQTIPPTEPVFEIHGMIPYKITYDGSNMRIEIPDGNDSEKKLVMFFSTLNHVSALLDHSKTSKEKKNYSKFDRVKMIAARFCIDKIVNAFTHIVITNHLSKITKPVDTELPKE